ncbi:hypothetical protein [Trichothermofontia sp.]
MKQTEIRQRGYQALIDALGIANTRRFLQQLGVGYSNYTQERHQWLDQLTMEDFQEFVQECVRQKSSEPNP